MKAIKPKHCFLFLAQMILVSCGSLPSKNDVDFSPGLKTELSKDEALNLAIEVIKDSGINITDVSKNDIYVLSGEKGVTAWSWGEKVGIYITEINGYTSFRIISKPKLLTNITATDWEEELFPRFKLLFQQYEKENKFLSRSGNFKDMCKAQSWTQVEDRTQGGAWMFFTGRGISDSIQSAYLKAESEALHRLSQECNFPSFKTRIIERCSSKVDNDSFVAYVRANITHDSCSEMKNITNLKDNRINQKMLKQALDYVSSN